MVAARADEQIKEQTPEPRWLAAGPPYLLTRDELIAELAARGFATSPRQLQSWVSYGVLPKPARRVPALADARVPRALYPAWLIPVLEELLGLAHQNQTIAQLKDQAPAIIAHWREKDAVLLAGSASATASAPAATIAGALRPVGTSRSASWQVRANPRVSRALQRAAWAYARALAAANERTVANLALVVQDEDGAELRVALPAPPPPRQKRHR